MTTTLHNLTPHPITIHVEDVTITLTPAKGYPTPRIDCEVEHVGDLSVIPVYRNTYGSPVNVPVAEPGTAFIVSAMVAAALKRPDIYSPGEMVRDDRGYIVGCKGLCTHV